MGTNKSSFPKWTLAGSLALIGAGTGVLYAAKRGKLDNLWDKLRIQELCERWNLEYLLSQKNVIQASKTGIMTGTVGLAYAIGTGLTLKGKKGKEESTPTPPSPSPAPEPPADPPSGSGDGSSTTPSQAGPPTGHTPTPTPAPTGTTPAPTAQPTGGAGAASSSAPTTSLPARTSWPAIDSEAWKDRIYDLIMEELRLGLERAQGKPLGELIAGFEQKIAEIESDIADIHREFDGRKRTKDADERLQGDEDAIAKKRLVLEVLYTLERRIDGDERNQSHHHLQALRSALTSKVTVEVGNEKREMDLVQGEDRQLLLDLCRVRMSEVNIIGFLHDLVHGCIGGATTMEEQRAAIKKAMTVAGANRIAVDLARLGGHTGYWFDPAWTNKPHRFGRLKMGEREVDWCRFGTPTIQTLRSCTIAPEFEAFIEDLRHKGQRLLYVNMQNAIPQGLFQGDETARVNALYNLSDRYPEALTVVTLTQDSPFYLQDGPDIPDSQTKGDFVKEFGQQMFVLNRNTSGFEFGELRNKADFTGPAIELLKAVVNAVIEEDRPLTVEERRDIIEIYYSALSLFIADYKKAHKLNGTCKDAMDRAGKWAWLTRRLVSIFEKKNATLECETIGHAAAIVVKKQPINGRSARLETADARLQERASQIRTALGALPAFEGIGYDPQYKAGQTFVPKTTPLEQLRKPNCFFHGYLTALANFRDGQNPEALKAALKLKTPPTSPNLSSHLDVVANELGAQIVALEESGLILPLNESDRRLANSMLRLLERAVAGVGRIEASYPKASAARSGPEAFRKQLQELQTRYNTLLG